MKKKKLGKPISHRFCVSPSSIGESLGVLDPNLMERIEDVLFVGLDLDLVNGLAEKIKDAIRED